MSRTRKKTLSYVCGLTAVFSIVAGYSYIGVVETFNYATFAMSTAIAAAFDDVRRQLDTHGG